MDKDKVIALSKLARVEITDAEAESLSHEFEEILTYVEEVKKTALSTAHTTPATMLKNIMREDDSQTGGAHESGLYTEAILNQAPRREGQFVAVKKIL